MEELFRRHKVKIVYLFGSQKERCIAFLKKKLEVYGDLYVDLSLLFRPFNIDIVFLQETDALFQYEAIKDALIYCEDESFLDDYEELVMKRAEDLSYKKFEFEKDFLEAIKDGYLGLA